MSLKDFSGIIKDRNVCQPMAYCNSRQKRILLICILLWLPGWCSALGLPDIKFILKQDPDLFWVESEQAHKLRQKLRLIADRGVGEAQILLAEQLSRGHSTTHFSEALVWFERGYANGQRRAVFQMMELIETSPRFIDELRPFFTRNVSQLQWASFPDDTRATLEILFVYPDLHSSVSTQEDYHSFIDRLLKKHARACLSNCDLSLLSAKQSEMLKQMDNALAYYKLSALESRRGVRALYKFLQQFSNGQTVFEDFAQHTEQNLDTLPLDATQEIATFLTRNVKKNNELIIRWYDAAYRKGAESSVIGKIDYMLSHPEYFSHDEVRDLVESIQISFPTDYALLEAKRLFTREWKRLNPKRSYALLRPLLQRELPAAYVVLGDLYSMGGLDEVDQQAAIAAYERAAAGGDLRAISKLRKLFLTGRGICRDKGKGHAYAKLELLVDTSLSGTQRIDSLYAEMTNAERERSESIYQTLRSRYPLGGFAL